ncbi:hypothetical protein LCGC14_2942410 [marine sediment metagenome]|uniref:Uncharacterized protein n=1 Tax=marine sediment metagenome TaxID=412755 RepID=A0A0F8XI70_9ZZZZ
MTAASLYSPGASTTAIIKTIIVCNQTAAAAYRIFVDDDGTTYDETTALFYDIAIGANSTDQIDTYYAMNDANGNLAVRTDTNSAITFTCFGVEIT